MRLGPVMPGVGRPKGKIMILKNSTAYILIPIIVVASSFHIKAETVERQAKGGIPSFEQFPAKKYTGKVANVKISGNRRASMYRTRIRQGVGSPNFAGHYRIITWGCGSNCIQFAIIDARIGSVFMPQELELVGFIADEEALQYRVNSSLLITVGSPNAENAYGRYYYVWQNNRLKLIKFVKVNRW